MEATLFDIQRNSYADGPGIRTTVFFKGCNLRCAWCHNPESQSPDIQMLFYKDKCIRCGKCADICDHKENSCIFCGKCALYCPQNAREICGKKYSTEEVMSLILKDKPYYNNSSGGVTFSGGECMLQVNALTELLSLCKKENINTAIDTAGNVSWDRFLSVMPYTDIFLYDVKCCTEELHISSTGVSNRLILENLQKLSEFFEGDIIIRIPVIPGFNDSDDEMTKISSFLKNIRYKDIELLPYHKLGEHKYKALGRKVPSYNVPSEEQMSRISFYCRFSG